MNTERMLYRKLRFTRKCFFFFGFLFLVFWCSASVLVRGPNLEFREDMVFWPFFLSFWQKITQIMEKKLNCGLDCALKFSTDICSKNLIFFLFFVQKNSTWATHRWKSPFIWYNTPKITLKKSGANQKYLNNFIKKILNFRSKFNNFHRFIVNFIQYVE
jgi:hypothetical protein